MDQQIDISRRINTYISHQKNLLELEERAQKSQERKTNLIVKDAESCLSNLKIEKISEINNNTQITLTSSAQIPNSLLSKGDYLSVTNKDEGFFMATFLSSNSNKIVLLATDPLLHLDESSEYKVAKGDNINYKIIKRALENLIEIETPLIELIFECHPQEHIPIINNINFSNKNLNRNQRGAVRLALSQPNLAIINGPPGTGKSTVILELLSQLIKPPDSKLLVCTPSNVAVDDLLFRFVQLHKVPVVRIGNDARIAEKNIQCSMSSQILRSCQYSTLQKHKEKILNLRKKGKKPSDYLLCLFSELRDKITLDIIRKSKIVFSTISSVNRLLRFSELSDYFDVAIIDESAQAVEALTLLPLKLSSKFVLAGDHQQLPPLIFSRIAADMGLRMSLMERMSGLYPEKSIFLTTQYRMNNQIVNFPSRQFYSGRLVADSLVAIRSLRDFANVEENVLTQSRLVLVDSSDMRESGDTSKFNLGEAQVVRDCVHMLIRSGVPQEFIGVITFYNQQVSTIRNLLKNEVEVSSVDSFQGREKEVVIISFVRSSRIGFLGDHRRINVALTRARRLLVVVANCQALGKFGNGHMRQMVEHLQEKATILEPSDLLGNGRTKRESFLRSVKKVVHSIAALGGEYVFRDKLSRVEKGIVLEIVGKFKTVWLAQERGQLKVFSLKKDYEDVLIDCLSNFCFDHDVIGLSRGRPRGFAEK